MTKLVCFMTVALFSQIGFAKFVSPDLSESEKFEYSEYQGEQTREIASKEKEEKAQEKKKERDVASDGPIKEQTDSGVKYWKY